MGRIRGGKQVMGTLLNLEHAELREVYRALTKGEIRDKKAANSVIKKVDHYLIDYAMCTSPNNAVNK